MNTDLLCIATGGQTYVQQFDWIVQATGHNIMPPVPSLFTFNLPNHSIRQLQGVAVSNALVKIRQTKFESSGPLLITHWGMSGPAVLRSSAFAARWLHDQQYHADISINWIPQYHENSLLAQMRAHRDKKPNQKVVNTEWLQLPARLLEYLLLESGADEDVLWGNMPAAVQNKLAKNICDYQVTIKGKTTFKEEFVTAGGITLEEVDSATMASKRVPGLYFAGEVLDVDGITGGFNFQHAWSSGMIAAIDIAARASND